MATRSGLFCIPKWQTATVKAELQLQRQRQLQQGWAPPDRQLQKIAWH